MSGSKPNPCEHAIARAGNFYFHIDGAREYPWYFGVAGYQRYLKACAAFVEMIFSAGGSNVSTWSNCPRMGWSGA